MKICPRCKIRPRKLTTSYCKECWAEYALERYRENPMYLSAERKEYRKNNKPLLRKIKEKWRLKHKKDILEKQRIYGKKYRELNKDKIKAHYILNNAIKRGEIKRNPCEVCGNTKVQAHHDDYNKPFDVHWVCTIHHWTLYHP